jgi:hypothetical protein
MPCKTIFYALEKADETQDVRVTYSNNDFPQVFSSLPGKIFNVYGVKSVVSGSSVYPRVNLSYSTQYYFGFTQASMGTINNIAVLVDARNDTSNKFFFYQNANGDGGFIRFEFDWCILFWCVCFIRLVYLVLVLNITFCLI